MVNSERRLDVSKSNEKTARLFQSNGKRKKAIRKYMCMISFAIIDGMGVPDGRCVGDARVVRL